MVCAVAITAVGTSQALHGAPQEQQQGDPLIDMATKEKVATQACLLYTSDAADE